jgi:transposase
LRRDILQTAASDEQKKSRASRFCVSESWVRRFKQEARAGKVAPATTRLRTPKWAQNKEEILMLLAKLPDLTLEELKAALGTELCKATLSKALRALKPTFKKSNSRGCVTSAKRQLYFQLSQGIDPDASCFWTNLKPRPSLRARPAAP